MAVEFNEPEFNQTHQMQHGRQGAVTNLLFKLGLAKSTSQANVVMLIVAVIAVALTIFLLLPDRATAPEESPSFDQTAG